jgi:hypothetical protein
VRVFGVVGVGVHPELLQTQRALVHRDARPLRLGLQAVHFLPERRHLQPHQMSRGGQNGTAHSLLPTFRGHKKRRRRAESAAHHGSRLRERARGCGGERRRGSLRIRRIAQGLRGDRSEILSLN